MLFTCLPEGAQIPGRFPGPMHARGKWFTIDIHCHVLTPQAEEMVKGAGLENWQPRHQFANEQTRQVNREQAERNRIQFSSVEKRLADMDRMGIDIQAITPSPAQTYYSAEPDLGIATARIINDNLADICAKHPDRFVGLGTVPFQAPELAVAELDRLHKSLGLRGIEIATNVAVHHLIFGGVLHQHPNLKLVLAHGGGYLPAYSGRIDHGASARPDTCEQLRHMPTTYLKRLYFDALVFTDHQLQYLVDLYGADHVLVGTDYPADMGEIDPIGFIERASGLDDAERRAILGRNAARLLNIEIPPA